MNLENYFISQFNSKHIGDDGALIDNVVYSKDAFFENVHFKRRWMSCFQIAQKAMLVNISDAVAMNAVPKYALLSVAMPKNMTKAEMKDLAEGFKSVAKQYNIEIIGGDTISNTKLDITVTIISKTKKPLLRTRVRENYLFAFTGELGRSANDLKKLQNLGKIHKKSKFVHIRLRNGFVTKSINVLKAGMDISDGLCSDLGKMASLNKTGVQFIKKIPKHITCSGEEYEMLIAFDARDLKKVKMYARQTRTKLTVFAKAVRNKYINRCKAHHF
ncbi:thiamine-phosphate kinase [Sulfurimonas sp. SWIR-19]|uniref:thiamine-phosphate kinase n=1 Tax=Sulfurimonas sp. SWIR-19 TaxID=2878390 RepID=UPI001CF26770|nr:thiamine-phosphate kinase [Sulfurimonas sp. SWIR-19]UCN01431.1 thiamine-phosphate kinase [Sulfurimonas sp. SWIR-19]